MSGVKQYTKADVFNRAAAIYVLASDYDTLRTANQRLEGEVARLREAASDVISNLGEWCCGLQTQDQVDYVTEQLDKLHAALAGKGGE